MSAVVVIIDGNQVYPSPNPPSSQQGSSSLKFGLDSNNLSGNSFTNADIGNRTINVLYIGAYAKVSGGGFTQIGNTITFIDGTLPVVGDQIILLF